jgi:hypothetical protein
MTREAAPVSGAALEGMQPAPENRDPSRGPVRQAAGASGSTAVKAISSQLFPDDPMGASGEEAAGRRRAGKRSERSDSGVSLKWTTTPDQGEMTAGPGLDRLPPSGGARPGNRDRRDPERHAGERNLGA